MYRVIKPRGTGKTSELMHIAEETGATIVCANPSAFKVKAHEYGFNDDLNFISYSDFITTRGYSKDKQFLIDEVDGLLQTINRNTVGYCLTPDD